MARAAIDETYEKGDVRVTTYNGSKDIFLEVGIMGLMLNSADLEDALTLLNLLHQERLDNG